MLKIQSCCNFLYGLLVVRSVSFERRDLGMKTRLSLGILYLALLSTITTAGAAAQSVPPLDKIQNQQDLDKAITTLDAALFDAYNRCDLEKFGSLIDEHVEFYHDQGGITLGRTALVDSVKQNICGKT